MFHESAKEQGLIFLGSTKPKLENVQHYEKFLKNFFHAEMHYLKTTQATRKDPKKTFRKLVSRLPQRANDNNRLWN